MSQYRVRRDALPEQVDPVDGDQTVGRAENRTQFTESSAEGLCGSSNPNACSESRPRARTRRLGLR